MPKLRKSRTIGELLERSPYPKDVKLTDEQRHLLELLKDKRLDA